MINKVFRYQYTEQNSPCTGCFHGLLKENFDKKSATENTCPYKSKPRKHLLITALLTISFFSATQVSADVFSFIAEDGTPHFSDQDSDSRYRLFLVDKKKASVASIGKISRRGRNEARYQLNGEILAAAQANGIEVALLHSIIEMESGYNPKAISPKGALGLMQLMPDTARRYGVTDPFNATQNLHGGARLLRDLLDRFSNDKKLALAAYNAGTGAVIAYGRRIPPYPETARYVPIVLQRYEQLRNDKNGNQLITQ